ncbi:unnamed protein product [Phytophthora fragariaefolia]|uniref:Unnamed protein product n=1 Tax=Phytophthora fragariaefolia TaxID=1490495 RepID=A0A9W6Y4X1_9STRA|nr:unnamed protein product [Phytophthora fragariaefolia]
MTDRSATASLGVVPENARLQISFFGCRYTLNGSDKWGAWCRATEKKGDTPTNTKPTLHGTVRARSEMLEPSPFGQTDSLSSTQAAAVDEGSQTRKRQKGVGATKQSP